MADIQAAPLFGGEVSAYFGLQTNSDPTVPLATGSLVPMGFINVPGINPGIVMDSIFPLGSFTRQQRNAVDYHPSASFEIELQDIAALAMAARNGSGLLGYYTMLFGNSSYAKQVVGMKCAGVEIDIPIGGRVSAKFNMEALLCAPSATAPSAMTYSSTKVLYGYNLTFTYGANTYTRLIKRVRVRLGHTLVRGPVKVTDLGSGSPIYALISTYLKETTQVASIDFELTNAMPISDVNMICRSVTSAELLLADQCSSNLIRITLADLSFANQVQNEGGTQEVIGFSAEADAKSIVIANA